ncbi:MAG: biosynthetic arginine decarboxylase, partial [Deltaproteobacteria bacterium]
MKDERILEGWTVRDSLDLYDVTLWSGGYFSINDRGHLAVCPHRNGSPSIDLKELVEDLRERGHSLPLLLRFGDILRERVREIADCFQQAIGEYGFEGSYQGVFPIKVNQQHQVVDELLRYGNEFHLGLEVGSKPEMLVALALLDDPEAMLVCNGYKDEAYVEMALLAQKLGRRSVLVIDRYRDLELVLAVSQRTGIRPRLGVRAKLQAKGAGRWAESGGNRSKFGLTSREIVRVAQRLEEAEMLDCLELLHFHMGSQVPSIRIFKAAVREGARFFVELHRMGAPMKYFDVGGGLAVDYDGSKTNFHSSKNYSMQEYANDVIAFVQEACDESQVPHPDIVTEAGRAMAAHHSVLVFDVLGVDEMVSGQQPEAVTEDDPKVLRDLRDVWTTTSQKNVHESYHDVLQLKEEASTLFSLGYLDLRGRARAERLFWSCCEKILRIMRELDYTPEDLEDLEKGLADTYYGNLSVFQSAPDHWAVKQLFPVMPIHRLDEKPTRRGVIADLTCDSDGKIDKFID